MTTISEVDKIRARIAALPAKARAEFQQEQVWATKHPVLYELAVFGAGVVATLFVVYGIIR